MTEAKGFRRPSRIFRGRCSRAPGVQSACYRRSGLTDRGYDLSAGLFPGLDAALEASGIEPELAETRRGATADKCPWATSKSRSERDFGAIGPWERAARALRTS